MTAVDKKIKANIKINNGIATYTYKDGSDYSFMCSNIRYALKAFKTINPNYYFKAVTEQEN